MKYESGGNPGAIGNNKGDIGGKSYGTYQFAINTGSLNSFMNHLKKTQPSLYKSFSGKKLGSSAFDKAWKTLAASNPAFGKAQHDYIKATYFDPAAKKIASSLGLNVNTRNKAVADALWSTAVQHGVNGALTVWKNAGINSKMSDKQILTKVYNERAANGGKKYFSSSSPSIRKSVVNRFKNELNDALRMLA